ncbi:MAG TPA: WD40 repeat domain-containing protein, partial [Pirellulaceae bacterium]|nr:WD40 repeat domain-containing protein [Pirellulaceae bacterium]
ERGLKFARRKPAWAGLGLVIALSTVALAVTTATYTRSLSRTNAELDSSNTKLQETNTDLRRTNYSALIDKTEDYWSRDPRNLARGMALLNSLVPAEGEADLRGIEWYFLRRLCDVQQQELYQAAGQAADLCCREDGSLLIHDPQREESLISLAGGAATSRTALVRGSNVVRWQFAPNSPWCLAWTDDYKLELRSSANPDDPGEEIARNEPVDIPASFSRDGSLVALIPRGQPPALWRREEPGRFRAITTSIARPLDVKLSPDGKWAATRDESQFAVTKTDTRKTNLIETTHGQRKYTAMAFSPDSQRLALASRLGQLDIVLLEEKLTQISLNLKRDFATPKALEFLPGGRRLALASSNAQVFVFDLRHDVVSMDDQDTAVYRGHRAGVEHLAADPSGKFLYSSAQDGQVLRWDLSVKDQRTHDIIEQTGMWFMNFNCLSYSPDGRWLAAGGVSYVNGRDNQSGLLLLIDVTTRQVRHRLDTPQPITSCSFSASGKRLLYRAAEADASNSQDKSQIHVWNVEAEKPIGDVDALLAADAACLAGDGRVVFAGAVGGLRLLDLESGTSNEWGELPGRPPVRIESLVASAGGTLIAGRSAGGVLRLWDATSGRQRLQSVGHGPAAVMALSADATLAAWTTPEFVSSDKAGEAGQKSSPEAEIAITSPREQQALVFDLAANRIRFAIGGHSSPIQTLAISADGKRLASGDAEGILKLWDTTSGQELMAIEDAHTGKALAAAFHPNNREMATIGSRDGKVRIWWTE